MANKNSSVTLSLLITLYYIRTLSKYLIMYIEHNTHKSYVLHAVCFCENEIVKKLESILKIVFPETLLNITDNVISES